MNKRATYMVEILHKDASMRYCHEAVVSVHEEGSYTTLVKLDGSVYKFPTANIFRLKITNERIPA